MSSGHRNLWSLKHCALLFQLLFPTWTTRLLSCSSSILWNETQIIKFIIADSGQNNNNCENLFKKIPLYSETTTAKSAGSISFDPALVSYRLGSWRFPARLPAKTTGENPPDIGSRNLRRKAIGHDPVKQDADNIAGTKTPCTVCMHHYILAVCAVSYKQAVIPNLPDCGNHHHLCFTPCRKISYRIIICPFLPAGLCRAPFSAAVFTRFLFFLWLVTNFYNCRIKIWLKNFYPSRRSGRHSFFSQISLRA